MPWSFSTRYSLQPRTVCCKPRFTKMKLPGLPNKNKCEELLNRKESIPAEEQVAVCVFDLNNLRTINNTMATKR